MIMELQGYRMYLPKTTEIQNIARLVLLVREGVDIEIKSDLMDTEVAAVWFKVGIKGRKSLLVGTFYREF